MEKPHAGRLGALLLLAWLWSSPGDSQRVEMPRKELEVVQGQTVVLQAWYSPTTTIDRNTISWSFTANDSKQIISYTSGEIGLGSPEFRRRVGFALPMPSANLSIYINNTQEADSGRYTCNVFIPGAPGLLGELKLNVKVPPSPPVCSMSGRALLKGNVTLSCRSDVGKPAPQYKWTRVAPVSEVFFSPMQNEQQGTLRLNNLTKSMSGKYVCRSSNTAGAESCYINLEVSTPTSAGVIAGAAVGSVLGLVAIILFLVFIFRRRRDTEEEIANEIKEDAQAPKRVSWAKSGTGSDIISKNGTLSSIATSPPPHGSLDQLHHHHHHHHLNHQQQQPGSNYSYTPPRDMTPDPAAVPMAAYRVRPGQPNPLHGLPGYNASGSPQAQHSSRRNAQQGGTLTRRPASAGGHRHVAANGPANHSGSHGSVAYHTPPNPYPLNPNGPVHASSPRPTGSSSTTLSSSPQPITANGPVHTNSPRLLSASTQVYAASPHPVNANGPVHSPSPRPINANGPAHSPSPRPINANGPVQTPSPRPINANGPVQTPSPRPINANGPVHSPSPIPISAPGSTTDIPLRTDGAEPQVPPLTTPQSTPQLTPQLQSQTLPQTGISMATLTRMGAVPVMVPAQSQAGSLV
ncbi:endothelial cell-selective adhesion molecule [Engraulis encrasicolus]|uniref:endothelial cell-selective adhesion molecule n=1 Tax=Engraulis encrasicolus TaxID=184585 RepID=UPI002FD0BDB4